MNKSNKNITFKGGKLTLLGKELHEGDRLPKFKITGSDLNDITNETFKDKTLVISVVPSLDTPVCSVQTKRFNQEASKLSDNVVLLTVSMDLPFAQKRWCGAEGATRVVTASDYKYRDFGENFGVYIQELGLLARAVFIADKSATLRYVEYVPEVTSEPEYGQAMEAVNKLA